MDEPAEVDYKLPVAAFNYRVNPHEGEIVFGSIFRYFEVWKINLR